MIYVDLDGLKGVNDSLGHQAGDELLVAVGGRLRSCVRPGDTAARLVGDEFAVLLEDVGDTTDVVRVAERIVNRLAEPFSVASFTACAAASIGIALGTPGRDKPAELISRADAAMYRAKRSGKGRYALDGA